MTIFIMYSCTAKVNKSSLVNNKWVDMIMGRGNELVSIIPTNQL